MWIPPPFIEVAVLPEMVQFVIWGLRITTIDSAAPGGCIGSDDTICDGA